MVWFARIGFVLLISLICISSLPTLFGALPTPPLVFAGVILFAMERHVATWLTWALLGGFILDMAVGGPGFYLPAFLMIGGLIHLMSLRLHRSTIFVQALLFLVSSITFVFLEMLAAGQVTVLAVGNSWFVTALTLLVVLGLRFLVLQARPTRLQLDRLE